MDEARDRVLHKIQEDTDGISSFAQQLVRAPSVFGAEREAQEIVARKLRWILIQSAQISHRCDPRFQHLYQRIATRRGNNKAIVAVAREMLTVAYYMLTRREEYRGVDMERYKAKLKRLERTANSGLH